MTNSLTVGEESFRVLPMTLNRHAALAEIRQQVVAAQMAEAEHFLELDTQRRRLQEAMSDDSVDREKVQKVIAEVERLAAEGDAKGREVTRLQVQMLMACTEPVTGGEPRDIDWWMDNYDLRRLSEDYEAVGLMQSSGLTLA